MKITPSLLKSHPAVTEKINGHEIIKMPEDIYGGFFTVDRKWNVEYWNNEAERLLGISREDIIGKNIWEKFATSIPLDFYANYNLAFEQNLPVNFIEYWPETSHWFDITAYPSENLLCVYFKLIDGDKYSLEQLLTSKIRYEVANQAGKIAVWDWNFYNGEFYVQGNGLKKTFGYSVEDAVVPFAFREECIHPDDKKRVLDGLTQFLTQKSERVWEDEYRFKRNDGNFAYVHDRGYLVYNNEDIPYRMIGSTQDITERKLAEIKVQQSERRFRALVRHGSDLIAIFDADGKFTYVSQTASCSLGFDDDVFVGKSVFPLIHPDDAKRVYRQFKTLKKEKNIEIEPFRLLNKNKQWRWMETILTNLLDDPAVQGIVANSRDITEKKKRQDELRQLSFIVQETKNPVIITDEKGKITWVNSAFVELTGYEENEIIGKDQLSIFTEENTDPETFECLRRQIKNKEPFNCEVIYFNKTGRKYWFQFIGQYIADMHKKGQQYFAILVDHTDKMLLKIKLDEEKARQDKALTDAIITSQENEQLIIGEGLQNNISQILGATKLYIEMAKTDSKNRSMLLTKSSVHIINVIEEINKLSKTIALQSIEVLGLFDSIKILLKDVEVENLVKIKFEYVDIVEEDLNEKMKLHIFRIIQKQLQNIIQHAQATGGTINLSKKGQEIELVIADNGQGFDSSKQVPGVGIKNVIARASLYDGKVTVESLPGHGFRLKVVLSLDVQNELQYNLFSPE